MIFGTDDRKAISIDTPSFYDYSPIVQIVSYFPDGTVAQGSGTIAGANDVVTAAHVVYSAAHGGYAESFEVTPLRIGAYKPFGVVYADQSIAADGWISSGDFSSDYALITLSRPIGYQSGWIPIDPVTPYTLFGRSLISYGYPGDLQKGNSLYESTGTVDLVSGTTLRFIDDMDAKGGQSGSGVFSDVQNPKLIGLISYEEITQGYNGIFAFDETSSSIIEGWINGNDADLPSKLNTPDTLRPHVEYAELMCQAFLGRSGEKNELDFLSNMLSLGSDPASLYQLALASEQYRQSPLSQMGNQDFLTHIFTDTLQMQIDPAIFEHYLSMLDNGSLERGDALKLTVESTRMQELYRLDTYETWHREYGDFAVEAIDNDEASVLIAKTGDSALWGSGGADQLIGNTGNDYLYGGEGNDTLYGGGGRDFFAWEIGAGIDTVEDFALKEDALRLRKEFQWHWETDTAGNLSLVYSQNQKIVLLGITMAESSDITVIQ